MKRRLRSRRTFRIRLALLALAASAAAFTSAVYITRPDYGLPFRAEFLPGGNDPWTAMGGTWEVASGAMRNESNDRGGKILTGYAHWTNYVVQADVQVLGTGSAGVLARVSDAETGENSFRGYFAGIRSADNSFVLGAFDFAYHEAEKVVMRSPVRPFRWYRIALTVNGCKISASVWGAETGEVDTAPLNDPDCFRAGLIGLRSNGTGGVWRNVTVTKLDGDHTRLRTATAGLPTSETGFGDSDTATGRVAAQPIADLLFFNPLKPLMATVRGSVVLTRPALFIQDGSRRGVEIQTDRPLPLKVGDEVEVTGQVNLDGFSPRIQHGRVRLLREDLPLFPVALTVSQVTTGQYDGRLIQVEGVLRSRSLGSDGSVLLDIDAGAESFRALLPSGRSGSHVNRLGVESRLRLRGVAVTDAQYRRAADPFTLLVRSAEDLEVLAGPPWWRPSTLIFVLLIALAVSFAINYLVLWVRHWRLRAMGEERERLAQDIHDTLAQSFAGIGFQLQAIRSGMPADAGGIKKQVDLAIAMTRTSHEEARRSIASLRPHSLGSVGLATALRDFARSMLRQGDVQIEAFEHGKASTMPQRIKDTLYEIGKEAIANAIRHAAPARIRIEVQREGWVSSLLIEDNGRGFDASRIEPGFGLQGIRKKAEMIAATVAITSEPGRGTRVQVKTRLKRGGFL